MSAGRIDSAPLENQNKLKRSGDEVDSNNDESKKRGRPRLNTQDESTADVSNDLLPHRPKNRTRRKDREEKHKTDPRVDTILPPPHTINMLTSTETKVTNSSGPKSLPTKKGGHDQ
jgi:hypothetical protein